MLKFRMEDWELSPVPYNMGYANALVHLWPNSVDEFGLPVQVALHRLSVPVTL